MKKILEIKVRKKPGLNSHGQRSGSLPKFIVIHHAVCPTSQCTFNTLKQRNLSTHYEVDKDGSIIEYLDPMSTVAWHAGSGFNHDSIGIDLTGHGDSPTGAQKQSIRALVTRLCTAFSIPQVVAPDGVKFKNADEIIELGIGIVRHRNVKATGCPGNFPMEILGNVSDAPIDISFSSSDEDEKKELAKDIQGTGKNTKAHKKEMSSSGGRFLRKFKYFLKEHPNFKFDVFYQDLDSVFDVGAAGMLPKYGKDYIFGPEHMNAWVELDKQASQSVSETKRVFDSWREFLKG